MPTKIKFSDSVPTNRLKGLVCHLLALHFVEHRLQVYPEFFGNTLSAPFIGLIETGHRTRLDIDRNTRHRLGRIRNQSLLRIGRLQAEQLARLRIVIAVHTASYAIASPSTFKGGSR